MLKIISWSEFCEGMAEHWKTRDPGSIPIWNNPFGIVQYHPSRAPKEMMCFPCAWVEDGVTKAYTSVYNISSVHLRTRGVFVKKEFRGHGIGAKLMRESWDLFPKSFYRVVEWFKETDTEWHGMKPVPGVALEWSAFSKCTLGLYYADRPGCKADGWLSARFMTYASPLYSLRAHLPHVEDWDEYFKRHAGNYPNRKINLDFRTS